MSATSSARVARYRYSEAGAVPTRAASERMVTAARPRSSASATPADASSARLCSGTGPRAPRAGRVQMEFGSSVICEHCTQLVRLRVIQRTMIAIFTIGGLTDGGYLDADAVRV